MTRNEVGKLIKTIATIYPNEYAKITSLDELVELWMTACKDHTGKQMTDAFAKYVTDDTSGFAPKPGQLIKYVKPERSTINNFADMPSHNIVIDENWWAELAAKPGNLI